jgi:hypothetical protein
MCYSTPENFMAPELNTPSVGTQSAGLCSSMPSLVDANVLRSNTRHHTETQTFYRIGVMWHVVNCIQNLALLFIWRHKNTGPFGFRRQQRALYNGSLIRNMHAIST